MWKAVDKYYNNREQIKYCETIIFGSGGKLMVDHVKKTMNLEDMKFSSLSKSVQKQILEKALKLFLKIKWIFLAFLDQYLTFVIMMTE